MTDEPKETLSIHEMIAQRRAKLAEWRSHGKAYPADFHRDSLADDLITRYGTCDEAELLQRSVTVKVAGRMMTRRVMGKAGFIHIQDMSGRIQLYLRQDEVGEKVYAAFKQWDLGDIVGALGQLFKTKTGELSVRVKHIDLLAKAIRPLPDKYHGLTDQESRYRQRYLDLLSNEATRRTFIIRTKIVDTIRQFLKERAFLEVETPMMQVLPGGAAAKPFITHHHALDMALYLRIAPELYLKRLVVGGFERVFEINRNFRNEGLSTQHNPEFTMLEFYQAFANYEDLIDLTESLMRTLAEAVFGTTTFLYQDKTFDFGVPFTRLGLKEAILKYNPSVQAQDLDQEASARESAKMLRVPIPKNASLGKIHLELFEKTVEHLLVQPTFITAYPADVSPLARRSDHDPFLCDRFEFFIAGREIANGFSELNDPEDQADRFKKQMADKAAGDEEAMPYDADYITALEHGLPPTAGEGIGIDRLVMLFTDSPSIRDVILFPHMRPKES